MMTILYKEVNNTQNRNRSEQAIQRNIDYPAINNGIHYGRHS